jgi:hypothetical protein
VLCQNHRMRAVVISLETFAELQERASLARVMHAA